MLSYQEIKDFLSWFFKTKDNLIFVTYILGSIMGLLFAYFTPPHVWVIWIFITILYAFYISYKEMYLKEKNPVKEKENV